jgi:hypothetical protein
VLSSDERRSLGEGNQVQVDGYAVLDVACSLAASDAELRVALICTTRPEAELCGVRAFSVEFLEEAGETAVGRVGVESALRSRPDVVVTDIALADSDRELLRAIRVGLAFVRPTS